LLESVLDVTHELVGVGAPVAHEWGDLLADAVAELVDGGAAECVAAEEIGDELF